MDTHIEIFTREKPVKVGVPRMLVKSDGKTFYTQVINVGDTMITLFSDTRDNLIPAQEGEAS